MKSATLHELEKVKLGSLASRVGGPAGGLGVVALIGAVVLGALRGDGMDRFFHSYLWNYSYFLSIAIGALFFVILHHLVKAHWSVVLRRIAESLTSAFPVLLILSFVFLGPMLLGNTALYSWSDPAVVAGDHLLEAKEGWLNVVFFCIRVIVYLAVFSGLAQYFRGKSIEQDQSGAVALTDQMRRASGPAMILFAVMTALTGFDLLMTLEPHWFSTIFGVYYFGGAVLALMCCLTLIPLWLQRTGRLTHSITVEHYHDVGKLMFAFVFFWGYIAFSQFMLIWMANIPEETGWYALRMVTDTEGHGIGWGWVSLFLLFFHFAVPFVCLLSRWTKRLRLNIAGKQVPILALFAIWLLFAHWVDLYWLAMPSHSFSHVPLDWGIPIDLLNFLGIGGLFVAAVARSAGKAALIPIKDPLLAKSLAFENQ